MELRERVIRDTMLYSAANAFAMAVGIGVSLAAKAILGAAGAGYWALLKVFQAYGEYADLGVRDALLREVPQAVGAGNRERAEKIANHAWAFVVVAAFGASAVLAAIAATAVRDETLRAGLFVVAGLVFATHAYNYRLNLLRILKKIKVLSCLIAANILFVGVFSLAGAAWGGVAGLAAGMLISTSLSAFLASRWIGEPIRFDWNWTEIKRLIGIGLPMVLLSTALVTFLTIDSVMIGKMIGVEELGYYTIGLMAIQQIGALGRFTQIIIFPHIQERYGATGSLAASSGALVRATRVLRYFLPTLIGACVFGIPVIVHYLLPRFEPGVASMKILAAGYYFVAVNEMSQTVLFTADRQKSLIPVYAAMGALAAGLNWLFIRAGHGIEGVAAATGIAYFLFFLCVFLMAFVRVVGGREATRMAVSTTVIFLYMALGLAAVERWVHAPAVWLEALLSFAVFAATQAPLLVFLEREERLFSTIARIMLRKKGAAGA